MIDYVFMEAIHQSSKLKTTLIWHHQSMDSSAAKSIHIQSQHDWFFS
jgi:hypothetical protein